MFDASPKRYHLGLDVKLSVTKGSVVLAKAQFAHLGRQLSCVPVVACAGLRPSYTFTPFTAVQNFTLTLAKQQLLLFWGPAQAAVFSYAGSLGRAHIPCFRGGVWYARACFSRVRGETRSLVWTTTLFTRVATLLYETTGVAKLVPELSQFVQQQRLAKVATEATFESDGSGEQTQPGLDESPDVFSLPQHLSYYPGILGKQQEVDAGFEVVWVNLGPVAEVPAELTLLLYVTEVPLAFSYWVPDLPLQVTKARTLIPGSTETFVVSDCSPLLLLEAGAVTPGFVEEGLQVHLWLRHRGSPYRCFQRLLLA